MHPNKSILLFPGSNQNTVAVLFCKLQFVTMTLVCVGLPVANRNTDTVLFLKTQFMIVTVVYAGFPGTNWNTVAVLLCKVQFVIVTVACVGSPGANWNILPVGNVCGRDGIKMYSRPNYFSHASPPQEHPLTPLYALTLLYLCM